MCEMLGIRAADPIRIEQVLDYATLLDEFGLAGFGWGMVWRNENGGLQHYLAPEGIRRDTRARTALAEITSKEYFIHLRRPVTMTTLGQQNVQPYLNKAMNIAFAHNGFFTLHQEFRPKYMNRLKGTSDGEVGFYYYLDLLALGIEPLEALIQTHEVLEGQVNMMVMNDDGNIFSYGGSEGNAMYTFEMDGAKMVTTSLHSQDNFIFQSVFPKATNIKKVELHTVNEL